MEVAFRAEPATLQHQISDRIKRKRCQLNNLVMNVSYRTTQWLQRIISKDIFVQLRRFYNEHVLARLKTVPFLRRVLEALNFSQMKKFIHESGANGGGKPSAEVCPTLEKPLEEYRIRWFFADWHENIWHGE
jgi:hypothetical protein